MIILYALFVAIVSYWIWRFFLPYPWADIIGLLGGILVFVQHYLSKKAKENIKK